MFNAELGSSIQVQLKNIALYRAEEEVEYHQVTSPFSRIYYIERGAGKVVMGNKTIALEPGYLYLIPSYTLCSYVFSKDMVQYYIHLSTSLHEGLNVFDVYQNKLKLKCQEEDIAKFKFLLESHPDNHLPAEDPKVYQNRQWMHKEVRYTDIAHYLNTRGILLQLLANFLYSETNKDGTHIQWKSNLKPILSHIQKNIHDNLSIEELADLVCLSKDHFARVFKAQLGITPVAYIVKRRIEKAQYLLLTCNLTQEEIMERTGFKSLSYFSKVFKKNVGVSPGTYRNSV